MLEGAPDVEGHAAHLNPPGAERPEGAMKLRAPGQESWSRRNGMAMSSQLFCPQAPLGPTVLSLPDKTRDPIWNPPLSFTG